MAGHREVAQRQEKEAAARDRARPAGRAGGPGSRKGGRGGLARARDERQDAVGNAEAASEVSERQRAAAHARHEQADEIEERVGPLDENGN